LRFVKMKRHRLNNNTYLDGGLESRDWAIGVYNQLAKANKDFEKIYPDLMAEYYVVLEENEEDI